MTIHVRLPGIKFRARCGPKETVGLSFTSCTSSCRLQPPATSGSSIFRAALRDCSTLNGWERQELTLNLTSELTSYSATMGFP